MGPLGDGLCCLKLHIRIARSPPVCEDHVLPGSREDIFVKLIHVIKAGKFEEAIKRWGIDSSFYSLLFLKLQRRPEPREEP